MKTVRAKIFVELHCLCPHCGVANNFYDYVANHLCLNVFDNVGEIFEQSCVECKKTFEFEIEN